MSAEPLDTQITLARKHAMLGMDVPWLLDQWADRTPEKPFLIWEPFTGLPKVLNYSALRAEARALAAGLRDNDVGAGDCVLLHLDNSPEFLISWFACALLGAIAVSTNTRSVAGDLTYFAEHTGAVCAITQPSFVATIWQACPHLRFIVCTDNNAGSGAVLPAGVPARQFADMKQYDREWISRPVDPHADLSIQFTSGTTSRPKAVLWTHANALWSGKISAGHMHLRNDDVALVYLPLFHTNAQAYSMLSTLWCGGSFVLQPKFSASRFWDVSLRHRVTWLSTIPFTVKALEGHPVPEHHFYRFWGASSHMADVAQRLGITTIGWWGMTETLTHGIVCDYFHPGPDLSIGRAAPEYDIQVRSQDGQLADVGGRGRLFIRGVRGVSMFKEYYGDREATDAAFDPDGWFDTGDVIEIDDDGYLFFGDRDKDMLRIGCENVAASEIERVILASGMVKECAVVGQRHDLLDEVPVAFVVPEEPAPADIDSQIIAYCRANLADFKVVRDVHCVDHLPRGLLDKVVKAQLRERLEPIVTRGGA